MTNRPLSVSATLILTILNALWWFAFGVIVAANAHPGLPDLPWMTWVMAVLAFAAAAVLLGLFFFLRRRTWIAYYLALAFFLVTCLLTIFDDFGLSDFAVLVINIIPVILLVKDRAWYLQPKPASAGTQ